MPPDQSSLSQIQIDARGNTGNQHKRGAIAVNPRQQSPPPGQSSICLPDPLVVLGEDKYCVQGNQCRRRRNHPPNHDNGGVLPKVLANETAPDKARPFFVHRPPISPAEPHHDCRNQQACRDGVPSQPNRSGQRGVFHNRSKPVGGEIQHRVCKPQHQTNNQCAPTRPPRPVPARRHLIVQSCRVPRQEWRHHPCHDQCHIPDRS